MNVLALILSGGMGKGLSVITQQRAKPAAPYCGKYRIIDFPLSNLVNSYIFRIAILTQFHPFSLIEHLGAGEPWGLHRKNMNGVYIWQPYLGRTDLEKYLGTADAVYQNRKYIAEDGSDILLILSGDQIYKQDYRGLLAFHREKGALLTIANVNVPLEEAHRYGLMRVDANSRITQFIEKPPDPHDTLASLGIYVFNTVYLLHLLEEDAFHNSSHHDFGRDIIPRVIEQGRAYAFPLDGFWVDIDNIETYWKSHMILLDNPYLLNLHDPDWVIHTRSAERPPVKVDEPGKIVNSFVSDGCIVHGDVVHSILSPGVRVEAGAVVRNAVIMNDTVIQSGAVVDRSVVDKEVIIGSTAQIGVDNDNKPNKEEPTVLYPGITVIGKHAIIPNGAVIGRNCRIDSKVMATDFEKLEIYSGETVHRKASR